jgi:hypothetical protein
MACDTSNASAMWGKLLWPSGRQLSEYCITRLCIYCRCYQILGGWL